MARGDTQHNFDTREPRLGDDYASIDPITGDRDTTKAVTVKVNPLKSPIAAPVTTVPPVTSAPCSLPINK